MHFAVKLEPYVSTARNAWHVFIAHASRKIRKLSLAAAFAFNTADGHFYGKFTMYHTRVCRNLFSLKHVR